MDALAQFIYALLPHVPLLTIMDAVEETRKPAGDAPVRPYLQRIAEKLAQDLGTGLSPQAMSPTDREDFLRHVTEEELRTALHHQWARYAAAAGPGIRKLVDQRLGTQNNVCPMVSWPRPTLTAFALDNAGEKEIMGTFIEVTQLPDESLTDFTKRFIEKAADAYVLASTERADG